MSNLSRVRRDKLIQDLDEIRTEDNKEIINQIENELKNKKYGLVWEEHEEDVEVKLRDKIPVFVEDKKREIIGDPNSDRYNFLLEGDNLHSLKLLELC